MRHPIRAQTRLASVILIVALESMLATAGPVLAEESPARLTLPEAVRIALQQNHDVLLVRENLNRLDGQIEETKSEVYPQVGLEADYYRSYDESVRDFGLSPSQTDRYGIRTTARQLLFSWGKVSTAVEIAEDSRRQAGVDLDSVVRKVKLQVHEAFYSLLLNQRLVEVAEERLLQRRRQLDVAEKKFAAGVVNEFEVIRARVEVANTEPPVIRAKNRVRQGVTLLNNLLARDQRSPLDAVGELTYEPLDGLNLEQVVQRAIVQRPELESLRVAREIAEKSVKIARAEDKPEVQLLGEYGFVADEFGQLNPEREKWLAGVVFTLPLFDGWRTRGQVAQAASALREVGIVTSQLEEDISLQAKVVLDDLAEARQIIDAASLNIEQAEKALELAETSYRYGVAIALDVTDAELSLSVARTNHARALHDYMVARARVLSVMDEL